jgi:aspartokinase-like uncharacterized kinase
VRIVVTKVGGSLFDYGPLRDKLAEWLARQEPAWHILVAGGGRLADAIRKIDDALDLGEEPAHWLAVDCLSVSTRLLGNLLPPTELITDWNALLARKDSPEPHPVLFDPASFLRHSEATLPGAVLPRSWQVTSDSIAARIAECLGADELVLLKSTDPPSTPSRRIASRLGLVDGFFGEATDRLRRIRFVNLRRAEFPEVLLVP